jgi:hypothetical protein
MASSRQVRLLLTYLTPTHLITIQFALRRREEYGDYHDETGIS